MRLTLGTRKEDRKRARRASAKALTPTYARQQPTLLERLARILRRHH